MFFLGFNYKLVQLEGTESSVHLDMLRLFAHGTWSDYKRKHTRSCFIFLAFVLLFVTH